MCSGVIMTHEVHEQSLFPFLCNVRPMDLFFDDNAHALGLCDTQSHQWCPTDLQVIVTQEMLQCTNKDSEEAKLI